MKTKIDIDVSGKDIFEEGYSIAIVINDSIKYGFRFNKDIHEELKRNNRQGIYNLGEPSTNTRLRIRAYSAIVVLLLKEAFRKNKIGENYQINICNDFDGHLNDIKDFIATNLGIGKDKIAKARHPHDSVIQNTVKSLNKGKTKGIKVQIFAASEINRLIKRRKR